MWRLQSMTGGGGFDSTRLASRTPMPTSRNAFVRRDNSATS
jgi:hypothetical protein